MLSCERDISWYLETHFNFILVKCWLWSSLVAWPPFQVNLIIPRESTRSDSWSSFIGPFQSCPKPVFEFTRVRLKKRTPLISLVPIPFYIARDLLNASPPSLTKPADSSVSLRQERKDNQLMFASNLLFRSFDFLLINFALVGPVCLTLWIVTITSRAN